MASTASLALPLGETLPWKDRSVSLAFELDAEPLAAGPMGRRRLGEVDMVQPNTFAYSAAPSTAASCRAPG